MTNNGNYNHQLNQNEPPSATRNLLNCQDLEISRRSFDRSVEMTLPQIYIRTLFISNYPHQKQNKQV